MYLIDTDVAIHVRDAEARITARIRALPEPPAISIMSLVELEGGVLANPELATARRAALEAMLDDTSVIGFDNAVVAAYGQILASVGHSRSRIIDRMIAATAIVHDLTLITINGEDFRDIPGLSLEVWPHPGAQ